MVLDCRSGSGSGWGLNHTQVDNQGHEYMVFATYLGFLPAVRNLPSSVVLDAA